MMPEAQSPRAMRRKLTLSGIAAVYVLLGLVLPIGIIVLWSVSNGWFPPSILPGAYSLRHWELFTMDETLFSAFVNSSVIAVAVTLFSMVLAVPTAWGLARFQFRAKRLVELFVLAPLIVPGIVVAVGLGRVFLRMDLAYTIPGVILVQTAGVLPLTIRILSGAFEGIPDDLVHAARSLGARRWQILRHLILPLGLPAMLAAGMLSFVGSFEEFERTFIVGAPIIQTLPTRLFVNLSASLMMPVASVVSLILLIPVLVVFLLGGRYMRDDVMAGGMGKL